jgi:5-methylcytosine-specific restriction endonuclease McrA
MEKRFNDYRILSKQIRKQFTETHKREIAYRQKYMCVGAQCDGKKLLPPQWQIDHIKPLHVFLESFTVDRDIDSNDFDKAFEELIEKSNENTNLQAICINCHYRKTNQEMTELRKKEYEAKYGKRKFHQFVPTNIYYDNPDNQVHSNLNPLDLEQFAFVPENKKQKT